MKLKNEQKAVAVSLYEEGLDKGFTSKQICAYINEELGLDLEESTYRKAYYAHQALKLIEGGDEEAYQDKLTKLTRRDIRQREERKRLVRERALVEQQVKDYVDKTAVAQAIEMIYGKPLLPVVPTACKIELSQENYKVYAFGDIHWGYTIDTPNIKYNKSIAMGRLDAFFSYVSAQISKFNLSKVYIADLGDDIEGAALRPSQLLRIVESMSEQAKGYANYIQKKYEELADIHPAVEIIVIHVEEDNHSQLRLHNTSRDELPENLQLLITNQLANFFETAHHFGALKNVTYLHAAEVLVDFGGYPIVFAHSHQYRKNDNILDMVQKRHQTKVHAFVGGHWHTYSHKNRNRYHGAQESLIFLPAVVGDTDYSDRLFYTGRPGFAQLSVKPHSKYVTSEQILFDE